MEPSLIGKISIQSLKDEAPPIYIFLVSPSKLATFKTKISKIILINTVLEGTDLSIINTVAPKFFRISKDFIEVSPISQGSL